MKTISPAWQPTATLKTLQQRAKIIATIRHFFQERNVLEVQTPLLCQHTVTDPHLSAFTSKWQHAPSEEPEEYYLQTSPEYAMKRLLAFGSGSIYQICPAFRNEPHGKKHNPEFTMLEWYRVGFDDKQLMAEVDALLQLVLGCEPAFQIAYHEIFQEYTGIDIENTNTIDLHDFLTSNDHSLSCNIGALTFEDYLQLIFNLYIEPKLTARAPTIVYDFPKSMAALAKIEGNVAKRFEVFYKGLELANGYHELTCPKQHHKRFHQHNADRLQLGLPHVDIDHLFITAIAKSFPNCAGVALGLDRLIMLALGLSSIDEVLAFSFLFA